MEEGTEKSSLNKALDAIGLNRSLNEHLSELGVDKPEDLGKNVLDIGSGEEERFAGEAKQFGINVVSLNPHLMRDKDRKRVVANPEWQRRSVAALAQNLPFKENYFDSVVADWSVSHYLEDPSEIKKVLLEIMRVLKPGGKAFIYPLQSSRTQEYHGVAKKILDELGIDYLEETNLSPSEQMESLEVKNRIEQTRRNEGFVRLHLLKNLS